MIGTKLQIDAFAQGTVHQAAADMEAREVRALARLGIADPYAPDFSDKDAN